MAGCGAAVSERGVTRMRVTGGVLSQACQPRPRCATKPRSLARRPEWRSERFRDNPRPDADEVGPAVPDARRHEPRCEGQRPSLALATHVGVEARRQPESGAAPPRGSHRGPVENRARPRNPLRCCMLASALTAGLAGAQPRQTARSVFPCSRSTRRITRLSCKPRRTKPKAGCAYPPRTARTTWQADRRHRDMVAKGVNLLIVNPRDPEGLVPAVNAASPARIAVIHQRNRAGARLVDSRERVHRCPLTGERLGGHRMSQVALVSGASRLGDHQSPPSNSTREAP